MLLWHYTTARAFQSISADGAIKPSALASEPRPAVHFSSNQQWEPTANKGVIAAVNADQAMTFAELADSTTLIRIGVDRATVPMSWRNFRSASGMTNSEADAVEASGRSVGGARMEWFSSFEPVPRQEWKSLQVLRGRVWTDAVEESLSQSIGVETPKR
jgi:hypothetical protein